MLHPKRPIQLAEPALDVESFPIIDQRDSSGEDVKSAVAQDSSSGFFTSCPGHPCNKERNTVVAAFRGSRARSWRECAPVVANGAAASHELEPIGIRPPATEGDWSGDLRS